MSQLKRSLSLQQGITLGVGSIIGSGVLFLPSMTFSIAGNDTLVVWIVATLLCIPLLKIFSDMVKTVPSERGIEGFISLGLGKSVGAAVPLLFLGTVTLGMPSAAIIAGQYLERYLNIHGIGIVAAYLLVWVGILSNLGGVKLGGKINSIVAACLFLVGLGLVAMTTPVAMTHYSKITPVFELSPILKGTVIAFWAYAGFENLTFISGEFKNPKRDFLISMIIALISCGSLYMVLSTNVAALVEKSQVDSIAGLYQLTKVSGLSNAVALLVTLFALFAVAINLISWTWGISRLVFSSAEQKFLPSGLAKLSNGNPRNATLFLGCVFTLVLAVANFFPQYFQRGLVVVSTNFVFIYCLSLLSYVVATKEVFSKMLGLVLLIAMLVVLYSSSYLILYPLGITTVAYILERKRSGQ